MAEKYRTANRVGRAGNRRSGDWSAVYAGPWPARISAPPRRFPALFARASQRFACAAFSGYFVWRSDKVELEHVARCAHSRVAVNGAPRWTRRPSLVTGCFSAEHPAGLFTDRTRHQPDFATRFRLSWRIRESAAQAWANSGTSPRPWPSPPRAYSTRCQAMAARP